MSRDEISANVGKMAAVRFQADQGIIRERRGAILSQPVKIVRLTKSGQAICRTVCGREIHFAPGELTLPLP